MNPENKEQESENIHEEMEQEILPAMEEEEPDIQSMMPKMQVSMPQSQPELENLITDGQLMGIYEEIIQNCREDRKEIDGLVANFIDMVINEGDASPASKETLAQLVKTRTDLNDKMAKVADLMTRVKLKERDTFPRYLAANQNNTINISGTKRDLLKAIEKKQKQLKGK